MKKDYLNPSTDFLKLEKPICEGVGEGSGEGEGDAPARVFQPGK